MTLLKSLPLPSAPVALAGHETNEDRIGRPALGLTAFDSGAFDGARSASSTRLQWRCRLCGHFRLQQRNVTRPVGNQLFLRGRFAFTRNGQVNLSAMTTAD